MTSALLASALLSGCGRPVSRSSPASVPDQVTFARDVAPILFDRCSRCHRPGDAAPFPLLSYEDAKKRARQIVEVTQRRYMPPWLPEPGYGRFVGERVLTAVELAILERWLQQGTQPGDASDTPPEPKRKSEWQLGTPDLVVRMPEPYTLPAEGQDVYRNFVVPIPGEKRRYVRTVEFDPGNPRIVHHAFFLFDRTDSARRRDQEDPGPGFSGIHTPGGSRSPEGHFLSWQPGKQPAPVARDMPWALEPGTDLIFQLHMRPAGKPENLQARLAFYFTDSPPTRVPMKIWLSSYDIEIPAGAVDHKIEQSLVLPADVDVLAILPHAHYLAREMKVFAELPNGSRQWLQWIRHWDFNWQGDYQYRQPVQLPQGTRLKMEFTYDNSTNNPVNPHNPPQTVRYGLQSSDEMAELWLQILPRSEAGRAAIRRECEPRALEDVVAYNSYLLRLNPRDPRAFCEIGKARLYQAKFAEAEQALRQAAALDAKLDEAHYFLGLLHRHQGQLPLALREFETALQINPRNARAQGNLGFALIGLGRLDQAEAALRKALELDPNDALARQALNDLAQARAGTPRSNTP